MQLRQPLNLRKPLQMTAHKIRPTLNLPFAASGSLGPLITYTGQNGTYFNSSGTLTAATTNVARFDYNPSTLIARGLLIEEARTNSIRNNTMVGAAAGTPGTLPTNWQTNGGGLGTLTQTIIGSGTANGISYIEVRLSGTTSTVSYGYRWESDTQIAATTGQTWTNSFFSGIVAGDTTNITSIVSYTEERTAAGAFVTSGNGSDVKASLTSTLQRFSQTRTLSGGGTVAAVNGGILLLFSSGVAIDITLRIGMPQLELGAFATSVISTSTVAVTRSADVASITGANFTSFWNATQGTIVAQYLLDHTIPASQFPTVCAANDGTVGNMITVYAFVSSGNNRSSFLTRTASVDQADLGSASNTFNGSAGTVHKLAGGYSANNFGAAFDGSVVLTDASGTIPTVDRLTLGNIAGGQFLNGWISSLSFYPVRLTNTQIQTLST